MTTLPRMTLARDKRIRKRREFLRVQRQGIRAFGRFVIAIAERHKDSLPGKIGITVPKKVGSAHERNLVKRRIRHILRLNQDLFFEKNLVIVARESAHTASFPELSADVFDACRRLKYHRSLKYDRSSRISNQRKFLRKAP